MFEEETEIEIELDPRIVIVGNPVDGFKYFGPFDSLEEAQEWAANSYDTKGTECWWIVELEPPDL